MTARRSFVVFILIGTLGLSACTQAATETTGSVTTEVIAEPEAAAEPAAESDTGESGSDIISNSLVVGTVDGGQLDMGSLAGQDVILWAWAPW